MKFREYTDLIPKTIAATNPEELDTQLERLSKDYDYIDLQFAMTNDWYAALALLRKKA